MSYDADRYPFKFPEPLYIFGMGETMYQKFGAQTDYEEVLAYGW